MLNVGGNITSLIRTYTSEPNEIGEDVQGWKDEIHVQGWLDLVTGDTSKRYKAEIEESTHMFMMDYSSKIYNLLKNNRCRFVIDDTEYDVKYCDDPMFLHGHLEIYLKLV